MLGELVKIVEGVTNLSSYKNLSINMATNMYCIENVLPCGVIVGSDNDPRLGKTQAIPANFTCWDKIIIEGPLTIEQLCQHLKTKYNLNIRMIMAGEETELYSKWNATPESNSMLVEKLYESFTGKAIDPNEDSLELRIFAGVLHQDIEALVPPVKYVLHNATKS